MHFFRLVWHKGHGAPEPWLGDRCSIRRRWSLRQRRVYKFRGTYNFATSNFMSVCYSCRYRYIYNPKSEWGPVLATFRFVFFVCVYAISSWALLYIALMGKTAIKGDWWSLQEILHHLLFHRCAIRRGAAAHFVPWQPCAMIWRPLAPFFKR